METYNKVGATVLVYEHPSCKGIFTQHMLTSDAIQSMHADDFDLPDDIRLDSTNSSSQKIKLLEGREGCN